VFCGSVGVRGLERPLAGLPGDGIQGDPNRRRADGARAGADGRIKRTRSHQVRYEHALVCLSNRAIVDASRGRTFHYTIANNRLIPFCFSNWVGLIH